MYGQLSVTSFTVLAPGTKLRLLSYLYPPSHLAGLCFEFDYMRPHSVAQAGLKITQSSCFGTSPKPQECCNYRYEPPYPAESHYFSGSGWSLRPQFHTGPCPSSIVYLQCLGLFLDPPLLFVFVTDVGQWTIIKRNQLCVFTLLKWLVKSVWLKLILKIKKQKSGG